MPTRRTSRYAPSRGGPTELRAKVEQLELALAAPVAVDESDEVAVWDASQAPTVIDLVGWDQRAAEAAAESAEDWRRHA